MMLDKLDGMTPSAIPETTYADPTSLAQRMRAAMGEEGRRPDFGDGVPEIQPIDEYPTLKPDPVPLKELVSDMCRRWFASEFMQAMLLGDPDEKLGVKPDPYA